MRPIAIAMMLGLAACAQTPSQADTASATPDQIDRLTDAVGTCPQIRPLLVTALADDRVSMGELRAIVHRVRDVSEMTQRNDSYDRARRAVGLPLPPRGPSCDPKFVQNLYSI